MAPLISQAPSFVEEQRMRQVWLWAIILIGTALIWYAFIKLAIFEIPSGESPGSYWWLAAALAFFGIALPGFLGWTRLRVLVLRDRVIIDYRPMLRRTIKRESIRRVYVRTYRPIREYGGWGIRIGWSGGRAYNAYGNRGVQLELTDGRKILIGSQRPEDLAAALERD